jgi:hypothetical protein
VIASSPEMRMTAMPPLPRAVEIAAIVEPNIEYMMSSLFFFVI